MNGSLVLSTDVGSYLNMVTLSCIPNIWIALGSNFQSVLNITELIGRNYLSSSISLSQNDIFI